MKKETVKVIVLRSLLAALIKVRADEKRGENKDRLGTRFFTEYLIFV